MGATSWSPPPAKVARSLTFPARLPCPRCRAAVQHECIPQAILGMDVICQAKSGMGKTAVFVISSLQQLEPVDGQVCGRGGGGQPAAHWRACRRLQQAAELQTEDKGPAAQLARAVLRAGPCLHAGCGKVTTLGLSSAPSSASCAGVGGGAVPHPRAGLPDLPRVRAVSAAPQQH